MQCRRWCGVADGEGRGRGLGEVLGGAGAELAGGDGAFDAGVGRAATVASTLGAVRGPALGGPAAGRDRPGRGAVPCAGTPGWLVAGAGGRAAVAGWCPCGAAAMYTAADVAAVTIAAVPNAAQCSRSTRPAPRSQRRPAAMSKPSDGTGSMASRQPDRREARSATRTAARWRSGGSASDT
jgi:hypothetical protein